MFPQMCWIFFVFLSSIRLQFLCWDPSMKQALAIPAAEMPFHISEYDTKFVLLTLDKFMEAAAPYVRYLLCDSHLSHLLVRRIFFGQMTPEDKIMMQGMNLKWLSRLSFEDLPENCLPRMPIRIASVDGNVYTLLGGPCSLVAIRGSQWFSNEVEI